MSSVTRASDRHRAGRGDVVLLNTTTFGYELRACGFNKSAARYAGISEKRTIVLSMALAGALAGTAGALMYLAPASGMHIHVEEVLSAQGFNGIPVALLGLSNPIGIIFSALFVAYISVGGSYLQSLKCMQEVIDIHRDGHLTSARLALVRA